MTRIFALCAAFTTTVFALPALADNSEMFDLKTAETKVAPGAKGSASLTIAAKGGWHVNMEKESPFKATLTPDAGVTVAKTTLDRSDLAVKDQAAPRFDIAFTAPGEAGKKSINAELRFIMCREDACKPVKEKVTLALNVEPAGKAAAPAPAGKAAAPAPKK